MFMSLLLAAATTAKIVTVAKVLVVTGTCLTAIGPIIDEKMEE
jgi:hypothetical protein